VSSARFPGSPAKNTVKISLWFSKVNICGVKRTMCDLNIRMFSNQYSMCDHHMSMFDRHLTLWHKSTILHDRSLTLCHNHTTLCHNSIVLHDLHLTLCHNSTILHDFPEICIIHPAFCLTISDICDRSAEECFVDH